MGESPKKPPHPATAYLALIPLTVGEVKRDMRHGPVYCPLVRFTAAGGTVVQFRDDNCNDSPHHPADGSVGPR